MPYSHLNTEKKMSPESQELTAIKARLDAGDRRMQRIESDIAQLREDLHAIKQQIADLLELFQSFKGAFRVLQYLGKLAKPLAAIVGLGASIAALWAAIKTGAGPR